MSFDPNEIENESNDAFDDEAIYVVEPEVIEETDDVPMAESVELETSFLHPSSLVFTVIAQIRQNLVPAIIALFGAARGSYVFIGIAAAIFVLSIIASTVRYLTLRYSIQNGELTVQSGLFFRRLRKVPTSQIQNIDLVPVSYTHLTLPTIYSV